MSHIVCLFICSTLFVFIYFTSRRDDVTAHSHLPNGTSHQPLANHTGNNSDNKRILFNNFDPTSEGKFRKHSFKGSKF